MTQFQSLLAKLSEPEPESRDDQQGEEQADDATVKAASAISERVFHHKLTRREKKVAGPAVHYAFGTGTGSAYGAAVELAPSLAAAAGLPFGGAVWLVADDVAVPALGLSKPPTEFPPSTHVYALASHFVYGATTELVRRAVRRAL